MGGGRGFNRCLLLVGCVYLTSWVVNVDSLMLSILISKQSLLLSTLFIVCTTVGHWMGLFAFLYLLLLRVVDAVAISMFDRF